MNTYVKYSNYDKLNQEVNNLRKQLARLHEFEKQIKHVKEETMTELLDVRRQITIADKLEFL